MARPKESEFKYEVFRKKRNATGFKLHTKHLTEKAAERSRKDATKRFGGAFKRKIE